jgi:biotin operon repressor
MPDDHPYKVNNQTIESRRLKDGNWYWVDKDVIQRYTPRIGAVGIAVYNFLASMANSTQKCFPSQEYVGKALGYSRTTVNRTIKVLEGAGLIHVEKRGNSRNIYRLLRLRERCKANGTQVLCGRNSDVQSVDTNNNNITRNKNNIDTSHENHVDFSFQSHRRSKPSEREQLLASHLAETLDDNQNLFRYLSYASKYPEILLRRVLAETREAAADKTKSKVDIFANRMEKYAHWQYKNPGN